jgi:hypothetical protein
MRTKGIILNTENVNATLEDRKTQTRRTIKPQPVCHGRSLVQPCIGSESFTYDANADALHCGECGYIVEHSPEDNSYAKQHKPRYKVGDILYVKEAYCLNYFDDGSTAYKADYCEEKVGEFSPTT